MRTQPRQQDIDLWEAWIEYEQFNSHFGTLYVLGEILVDSEATPPFLRKKEQSGRQLILQTQPFYPGRSRRKEVLYSEPINNLNQYSSICIYDGSLLIAEFDEIEILI
ncbi:MAG: hypothetical protein ACJ75B_12245 [Flavisolibacter sp.]|jgi:hypothetical protein